MRWIAALALLPLPALAEPIAAHGYLTTCIDDSCEIVIAGVGYWVLGGEGTETDLMISLYEAADAVTPVAIAGQVSRSEGLPPELVVEKLDFLPPDDHSLALTAAQGVWQPDAADMPYTVSIDGLHWRERQDGKKLAEYRIFHGTACADGVDRGGLVLSLRPKDADVPEAACWQVLGQTDEVLTLRQITATARDLRFDRKF